MKKLSLLILVTFITLTEVRAQDLKAMPFTDLVNDIEASQFTYKEKGLLFGFISIQSCLYLSQDIIIFKNYCYPKKKYPARGYTIISKKYGTVDLYEQVLPDGSLKKDIQITQFPSILAPYLSTPVPEYKFDGLSAMIEKMYNNYYPGCWSTNFSFYTETDDVNCTVRPEEVEGVYDWADETQKIVMDEKVWLKMMSQIEAKLPAFLND